MNILMLTDYFSYRVRISLFLFDARIYKYSYQPSWNNKTKENFSLSIYQSFKYKIRTELDTYISIGTHRSYGGGDYIYEFCNCLSDIQSNLSKLHQLEWINNHTRTVIIQFNFYNPNVQLFTSVTLYF